MNLNKFLMHKGPLWEAEQEGGGATTEATTESATTEAPDYSFLPEDYVNDGTPDIDGFKTYLEDVQTRAQRFDESRADVPEKVDGYEFAVPDDLDFGDLDLPEGFTVDLKADDEAMKPLFSELGGIMHKYGMPKGAAQEMMGLLAKYEASKYAPQYAAGKEQMAALGPTANKRIGDLKHAIEAKFPKSQAEALMNMTSTAAGVQALETLLAPRPMKTPNPTPNNADLEGLSPYERLKVINARQAS